MGNQSTCLPRNSIHILEKRALPLPAVIGNLRQFVAKSLKIVTPESLAKLLVERGLLTQFQAKKLFEPAPSRPAAQDDDLSLAPSTIRTH